MVAVAAASVPVASLSPCLGVPGLSEGLAGAVFSPAILFNCA